MAVLVCIPTNSVRGFPFLHMFQHLALNLVSLLSRPPHTIPSVSDLTWATPTLTLTQMSLADSDSTVDSPSHNKLHCSHTTSPARSSVLPHLASSGTQRQSGLHTVHQPALGQELEGFSWEGGGHLTSYPPVNLFEQLVWQSPSSQVSIRS